MWPARLPRISRVGSKPDSTIINNMKMGRKQERKWMTSRKLIMMLGFLRAHKYSIIVDMLLERFYNPYRLAAIRKMMEPLVMKMMKSAGLFLNAVLSSPYEYLKHR